MYIFGTELPSQTLGILEYERWRAGTGCSWLLWLIEDWHYCSSSPSFSSSPLIPYLRKKRTDLNKLKSKSISLHELFSGTRKIVLFTFFVVGSLGKKKHVYSSPKYKEYLLLQGSFQLPRWCRRVCLSHPGSTVGFAAKVSVGKSSLTFDYLCTHFSPWPSQECCTENRFGCSSVAWTNTVLNTPQRSIPKSHFFTVNCIIFQQRNVRGRKKIGTAVL